MSHRKSKKKKKSIRNKKKAEVPRANESYKQLN